MGATGSKYNPLEAGYYAEVGIKKSSEVDLRFDEVRRNYQTFYRPLGGSANQPQYLLHPHNIFPFWGSNAAATISPEDKVMIKEKLKEIAKKHRAVFRDRYWKVLKSPYVPYSMWYSVAVCGSFTYTAQMLRMNPWTCVCSLLFAFLTLLPLLFVSAPTLLVLILVDILFCRYCYRPSDQEKAWIDQFMTENPQFDQDVMDAQMAQDMQKLADVLNRRYLGEAVFVYEKKSTTETIYHEDGSFNNYFTCYVLKIWHPRHVPAPAIQQPPQTVAAPAVVGNGPSGQPMYGQAPVGVAYGTKYTPGYAPVPTAPVVAGYPPSGYPPSGYPPSSYPPSGYPPSGYVQQQPQPYAVMPVESGGAGVGLVAGSDVEMATVPKYVSM